MNNIVEFATPSAPWFGALDLESVAQLSAFEPFVDERVVARFLQITPRRVLEMARRNEIPAHPLGLTRKTWRFRISEIDAHFSQRTQKQTSATIGMAVPGTQGRKQSWAKGQ